MVFKKFENKLILRVFLLLITLSLPAIVWVNNMPELLVFLVPLLLFQVAELIRFQKQAQEDLTDGTGDILVGPNHRLVIGANRPVEDEPDDASNQ